MYDKKEVLNHQIQQGAEQLHADNLLTAEQWTQTQHYFPNSLHQASIFVKIGLFLFTTFSWVFFQGIFALAFGSVLRNEKVIAFLELIIAFLTFALLQLNPKNKFYNSGVDNALIYLGSSTIVFSLSLLLGVESSAQAHIGIALLVLGIIFWRTGELLVGLVFCFLINQFFFLFLKDMPAGRQMLPFLSITYWMFVGWQARKFQQKEAFYFWHDALESIEILALIFVYLSGNYYFVHTMNASYWTYPVDPASPDAVLKMPTLSLGFLFWAWTAFIPLAYGYLTHRLRERKYLIISLLCMALSIMTYRHFYSVMPLEWALTIGGGILILLSWFLIRKLKTPQYGFSDEPTQHQSNLLETLITSQILKVPHSNDATHTRFGQGDTGGGGASGGF